MKACFLFGLSAIGFYSLQIYAAALLVGLLLRGSSRPLQSAFHLRRIFFPNLIAYDFYASFLCGWHSVVCRLECYAV